jgi:Uma2 family endonuclease
MSLSSSHPSVILNKPLEEGKVPHDAYPQLAPNLAVEVLSPSNTKLEMARKRREYFHAGVQQVWLVDIRNRSVAVYTSSVEFQVLEEHETLTAESIFPGLSIRVSELFADLD